MKRTGEVVLGIIGSLAYAFFAIVGGFMAWLQGKDELLQDIFDESAAGGAELSQNDMNTMVDAMGDGGMMIAVSSVIAIILGIIAMVLLKGNKKPKVAGIIFIVVAVVISFVSFGTGILGGIFFLIAGIMCLVRKPQTLIES